MCGIAGVVSLPQQSTEALAVERMLDSLEHRGPDSRNVACLRNVILGTTRLAITDIDGGEQPFFSENRDIVAIFNGEIFNARSLRQSLERRGHSFRSSHADGEVIPHLFEEYGPRFPEHLEGMFAIAVWDEKVQTLYLARDHFGIKPLFVQSRQDSVAFASEIKALLGASRTEIKMFAPSLDAYFRWGFVPGQDTVFEGIRQVAPGSTLTVQWGRLSETRYWSAEDFPLALSEKEVEKEIASELQRSVELQVEADAPVGVFLSGGLDSSAVACLASLSGKLPLTAFSLTYPGLEHEGKSGDTLFARQLARQLDVRHVEVPLYASDLRSGLHGVVRAFDQPFAGVTSTYYLSSVAASEVKVVLSGEGADELFGSYLFHRGAAFRDWIEGGSDCSPREFNLTNAEAAAVMQASDVLGLRRALTERYLPSITSLYSDSFRSAVADARDLTTAGEVGAEFTTPVPRGAWLRMALKLDQAIQLPDEILTFSDRLSMAHSLEVRPPFLTPRMCSLSRSVPFAWLIRPSSTKHILREALRGLLPETILRRPKEGFVPPLRQWLGRELLPWCRVVLSPERTARHGFWRQPAVDLMLDGLSRRPDDYFRKVWTLVVFQLWFEAYDQ
jgi:asparagine synthase (glutamine-hydrolysing)